MKRFATPAALVVLLALSLAFAACGDDGDKNTPGPSNEPEISNEESDANITTQKGLTVTALNAGFGPSGGGENYAAPAAADSLGSTRGLGWAGAPGPSSGGGDSLSGYSGDQSSSNSANAQTGEGGGLTVTGYGTATAPADSAVLEFYFNTNNYNCGVPGSTSTADRITEETLQPVADALVAVGVAAEDIEFVSQGYYDACYNSGNVRAIVRDVDSADSVATAVSTAAADLGNGIVLGSTNVSYTLEDCAAIEAAATRTAAEDAADNAERLADALGLNVGSITAASDYSNSWYYPYFGTQTCGSSYYGPMPFYAEGDLSDAPKEVQVFANINVTYAIN